MTGNGRVFGAALRAAILVFTLPAAGPAGAQEPDAGAAPALEEIVVTARKREETLSDVPISVSALTAEALQRQGAQNDNDIAALTVGFDTLVQTGRDVDRPTIRGMGNPPTRGEPNASYFIDGVFVSTSIATTTTSGIERVEVLRGPQSAQFGRATFSGAVNYVTRSPTDEFQGEVTTRAGTHDDYLVGGWWSGPLVEDRLLFLLSGSYTKYGGEWENHLRDGPAPPGTPVDQIPYYPHDTPPFYFSQNAPTHGDGSRLGGEETTDFLGKLVFRPWDSGEFTLKYSYTKGEDDHFSSLLAQELNCFVPSAATAGESWYATSQGEYCGEWNAKGLVDVLNLPDFREGIRTLGAAEPDDPDSNFAPPAEPGTFREDHRILLEYVQSVRDYDLTVRGGWNKDEFQQVFDLDHTGGRPLWGLFHFDNRRDIEDYSLEIRLDGPANARVVPHLGVYWYDQDRTNNQRSFVGPNVFASGLISANEFPEPSFLDISNKAIFGGVDLELSDTWTLVLEGRYAEDKKELTGGAFVTEPGLPPGIEAEFKNFTPRIILRNRPTDTVMYYLSVAKGNKPGDFNTEFYRAGISAAAVQASLEGCDPGQLPLAVIPCTDEALGIVKEEEQWTYEVGTKLSFLDGRLSTNFAFYYIDWKNQGLFSTTEILQTAGTYLTTTVVRNVGESEVTGLEWENTFAITDRLTVTANYGLANSKYTDGIDPIAEDTVGSSDISGNYVPNVPKHSVVLALNATAPIADGYEFFLAPNFSWESRRYTGASNLAWLGNRQLVNLRAGVQADHWTLTGYVRNLLDDQTPLAALDFVNFDVLLPNGRNARLHSLSPQRGRDYGLELQYRF